jgi:hypothetical protein
VIAPEWYPRPNDRFGHVEEMVCVICCHEWSVWVTAQERDVACPACGYQNSLGEV